MNFLQILKSLMSFLTRYNSDDDFYENLKLKDFEERNKGLIAIKNSKKSLYFLYSKKNIQVLWLVLIIMATSLAPSVDSILLQNLTDQIEFYSSIL